MAQYDKARQALKSIDPASAWQHVAQCEIIKSGLKTPGPDYFTWFVASLGEKALFTSRRTVLSPPSWQGDAFSVTLGSVYNFDFFTMLQSGEGKAKKISSLLFDTSSIKLSDFSHQTIGHVRVALSPSDQTVFQVKLETDAFLLNTKLAGLKKEYITLKQTRIDKVARQEQLGKEIELLEKTEAKPNQLSVV